MVTSIAIPNATLKTNTVEGFKRTPAHPIMPAVTIRGITFGIREQKSIRKDLNKYNMHKAINKNAQKILSFKPLIIKRSPSKNVMVVPVNCTLYFDESKSWLVRFEIPFKISVNLLVPTSAIFMLILVLCLAVSINEVSNLLKS